MTVGPVAKVPARPSVYFNIDYEQPLTAPQSLLTSRTTAHRPGESRIKRFAVQPSLLQLHSFGL